MTLTADNFDILKTVNDCQVSQLRAAVNDPANCADFYRRVHNAEAAVIHTYQITAQASIREEDPRKASILWKDMTQFCESMLVVLRDLKEKYPTCGADNVYNTTLDYWQQAQVKYMQNLQDSECQTMPEGLFPPVN
jgi:hypothetical protein